MSIKNHYRFGQIIMDKFAVLTQNKIRFHVEISGKETFDRLLEQKEGFIIAGAHIGNFEIGGYLVNQQKKNIFAIVFAGEMAPLQQKRKNKMEYNNIQMMHIQPDMSHIFQINQSLDDGAIVSMHCDRFFGSTKSIRCTLLGHEILLPAGAFRLAAMRQIEILVLWCMKEPKYRYKIYLKSLNESLPENLSVNEKSSLLAQNFCDELELILNKYPEQ